jgi:hypothetical protein
MLSAELQLECVIAREQRFVIRQASLAGRVAPVLRFFSSAACPSKLEHSSVRDRQLAVKYAGPVQFTQEAFPTAVVQA